MTDQDSTLPEQVLVCDGEDAPPSREDDVSGAIDCLKRLVVRTIAEPASGGSQTSHLTLGANDPSNSQSTNVGKTTFRG